MKTLKIFNHIKKVQKIVFRMILAVLFIMLSVGLTSAQNYTSLRRVELGVRYMPTISAIDLRAYNNDVIHGSASFSQGFGFMLGLNLNKHFGLQAEVNYYQVSQSFRDVDLSNKVNIKYFNIPLLVSLNTNKEKRVNFNIVAGPSFGINAGATIHSTGTGNPENIRAVVAVKKGDIGFAYGAGLEFALNYNHSVRLDLGYRGFYGVININASKTEDDTYNVIAEASRKTNAAYVGLTILF